MPSLNCSPAKSAPTASLQLSVECHDGLILPPALARKRDTSTPGTHDQNAVAILGDGDAIRTNRTLVAPNDIYSIASAGPFSCGTTDGVRGGTILMEYHVTHAEIPRPCPDNSAAGAT
jgi:hypothetical protein